MKRSEKIVVDSDEDGYALPESSSETDLFNTPDDFEIDWNDDEDGPAYDWLADYRRKTGWGRPYLIRTPIPKMIEHLYFGNTLKSDWIEPDVLATSPLEEFGIWEMPDYLTDHQVDAERDELFVSLTIKLNNTDH